MKEINLGTAIRQRRKELGLSQSKVCDGLCSTNTLSRMENGTQTLSYNILTTILQRLGMPEYRYYALLSENEEELEVRRKELISCAILFRRASVQERTRIREQTMKALHALEEITEADDRITHQYILSVKAALGTGTGPYSSAEKRAMLIAALQLTVPHFDPKKIDSLRYSLDEIRIIGQIAMTYSAEGEHEKAISLYSQLLKYIRIHDQDLVQYAGHLSLIAHNYARELGLTQHYEEAVEIAELGWKTCIKYGHYQFLPGFLAIIAECKYFLGELEESRDFYFQAHYLYKSTKNKHNQNVIDNEAKERLQIDFPS